MTEADGQTPSAAGMDPTQRATSMDGVEADSSSQQVGLGARTLQAWVVVVMACSCAVCCSRAWMVTELAQPVGVQAVMYAVCRSEI